MSGGRTVVTQSHSMHGGALSFMSCTSGRESSPLDENESHQTGEFKTETKKKRFHPLRNLRRMFRRKARHSNASNDSYNMGSPESTEISTTPLEQRSCSTSKLAEENGMQNLMKNNRLAPGLSLSHDSVFTPDRADSGLSSSDLENSSLSISNFVPPPMECPLKSHSSCSESSLLSMDSSEAELSPTVIKSDLDLGITSYKLSHSAAKHKMAVKPKRNHGAPRSRRKAVNSKSPLPSTPEVNEEAPGVKGFSPSTTDFFTQVFDPSPMSKTSSPITEPVSDKSPSEQNAKPVSKCYESDFVLSSKISRSKSTAERNKEEPANYGGVASKETGDKEAEEAGKSKKSCEEQGDVNDDDWGDKDEEISSRKEESFFGRLLSRRSEKKKKGGGGERSAGKEEASAEEPGKATSPVREGAKGSGSGRSVTRRQRVEPIEIPSSPSAVKKGEGDASGRNLRENCSRMKISYSMSPPKSVLPNPIVSRSSSPPKVIWPDNFSHYKNAGQKEQSKESGRASECHPPSGEAVVRSEGRVSLHEDSFSKMRRDLSPTVSKTKETQKIIADEVESKFKLLHALGEERAPKCFETSAAKEESARVMGYEKDGELDKFKVKRNHSQEEDAGKSHASKAAAERSHGPFRRESDKLKSGRASAKSNSGDSVEKLDGNLREGPVSLKSASTDLFTNADVLITHEEPHYVNLKNILPVLSSYEKVHHGYENVQVIELVKKEKESKAAFEDKTNEKIGKTKEGEDSVANAESPDKKAPKFERPKSMRRDAVDGTPEFMKVQLNRVEPRAEVKVEEKVESPAEKAEPPTPAVAAAKAKSTLIERRKSELMLTTEVEEKDWKPKVKVLRKQTSFTENASPKKQTTDGSQESSPAKQETVPNEKTEVPEEPGDVVVMRKKPSASGKGGDDQPELMKVFARRSLKVRESEEIVEEMRRSRDSDKENENSESPKEERKKMIKCEPEEKRQKESEKAAVAENETSKMKKVEEVVIQVTPLKAETGARKSVFQKYGRGAAENGKVAVKTGQQDKVENGVSSAENRGKTRKEHAVLEESKCNKMAGGEGVAVSCMKEANAVPEEDSEDTGFKRIQQRKAEWERRVQQAAK